MSQYNMDLDDSLTCPITSATYLCETGTWETVSSDVTLGETAKAQVAEIVKEELGKILLELSTNGSIPLTEVAKDYFIKKL